MRLLARVLTDHATLRFAVIQETEEGVYLIDHKDAGLCGDTWHPTVQEAQSQADYNYGSRRTGWHVVPAQVEDLRTYALAIQDPIRPINLPRLYVIADAKTLTRHNLPLADFARQLHRAGVTLVQLRDKSATPASLDRDLAILRAELPYATLLLNDQPHPGFNGAHFGQTDSPIATPFYGLSTHTPAQVTAADQTTADYLAIGPVFATSTKPDAAPVVRLEGIRQARALTRKPLVAIGGITRQNCREVIAAGADSVAVISALFAPGETVEQVARDFLRILR